MENVLYSEQKMLIFKHLLFIENKDFLNYIQTSIEKFVTDFDNSVEHKTTVNEEIIEPDEDENEKFDENIDENIFLEDFNLTVGELRKKVQIEEQGEQMTKKEFFKSYEEWRAAKDV